MKIKILFSLLFIITFSMISAQNTMSILPVEEVMWHDFSAKTVQKGRIESGIFAPLRFGLKNQMEIQVHPILFFVMPNARIKKNWTVNQSNKWQFGSEHGFTIPTILLSLLAREGVGGILPPTKEIPMILTLKNKAIASYFYHKNHSISFKAAMEFNVLQSMGEEITEIEFHFAYPRTSVYNNTYTGEIAMSFAGNVAQKFGYDTEFRTFFIPNDKFTWVLEINPKIYYNINNKVRLMLGAIMSTGNIPHEKETFRVLPVLDLQFAFGKKR